MHDGYLETKEKLILRRIVLSNVGLKIHSALKSGSTRHRQQREPPS